MMLTRCGPRKSRQIGAHPLTAHTYIARQRAAPTLFAPINRLGIQEEDFGEGAGRTAAMAPGLGSMHDGCGRGEEGMTGGAANTPQLVVVVVVR